MDDDVKYYSRGKIILVVIVSILLIILYTISSTYAIVINVIEEDGVLEIIDNITIKSLLTNDLGTFNETYYQVRDELNITDEEALVLMESDELNNALQEVFNSVSEVTIHDNESARLSNDYIYNLICVSVNNDDSISDDVRKKVINKSNYYKSDISDYVYGIDVNLL